jgi:hypothetical protein
MCNPKHCGVRRVSRGTVDRGGGQQDGAGDGHGCDGQQQQADAVPAYLNLHVGGIAGAPNKFRSNLTENKKIIALIYKASACISASSPSKR